LIANLFILDNTKKKFTVYHSSRPTSFATVLLQEDLTIAHVSVNVLGCYYKNANVEKWNFFWKDDVRFFSFILSRSNELFYGHKLKFRKNKRLGKYEKFRIIPWKNQIPKDIPPLKCQLGFHPVSDYKVWVIPYQEKHTNS
jgi:hypothetical protein